MSSLPELIMRHYVAIEVQNGVKSHITILRE